jgi:hypothetical protein
MVYYTSMSKSSGVIHKIKRFQIPKAAEGKTPVFSVRLPEETRHALDKWAAAQEDRPGRGEAIRRLVEQALEANRAATPKRGRGK